jgi:hypothetical protein
MYHSANRHHQARRSVILGLHPEECFWRSEPAQAAALSLRSDDSRNDSNVASREAYPTRCGPY